MIVMMLEIDSFLFLLFSLRGPELDSEWGNGGRGKGVDFSLALLPVWYARVNFRIQDEGRCKETFSNGTLALLGMPRTPRCFCRKMSEEYAVRPETARLARFVEVYEQVCMYVLRTAMPYAESERLRRALVV